MPTIGLLGGSFDPIHKAHLAMAKAILKDGCQEVWFLPCVVSPLKDRTLSSFDLRKKMIEAAIRPYRKMKVCTIEKELASPSYTIHTLTALKKKYPDVHFVFYIGNDQAKQLNLWKDIEACFKLAEFRCFKRNEERVDCPYPIKSVTFKPMDISSTQVRRGKFFDTVKPVRNLIWKYGLYLEEFVSAQMSEKRFNHSVSVANLSKEIAHAHGLNEDEAYRSGLLHDVCKQWPKEKSEAWMKCYEASHLDEPIAIWHGYLCDHFLKRYFPVNKTIQQAVHWHVLGKGKNPIADIVYMADKLDPLRDYDSSQEIEFAKRNLKAAKAVVYEQQQAYLTKEKVNG